MCSSYSSNQGVHSPQVSMHLLLKCSLLQNSSLADSVTKFRFVFSLHQNVPRPGILLSSHSLPHLEVWSQPLSHRFFFLLHLFSPL